MKKLFTIPISVLLVVLSGCAPGSLNSRTGFLLDTFVTLTADCGDEALDSAFALCSEYEGKLSRTAQGSEISLLNAAKEPVRVSEDTAGLIGRSLAYCALSGGKFDITIYPLSSLWDFSGDRIPSRDEIAEALQNIDYQSVEVRGDWVDPHGKQLDLGAVAKGFIADRLTAYLKEQGARNGTVNLGGNVVVFGKAQRVGIQSPFESDEVVAYITLEDLSAVTSGSYQRYIEQNGEIYHHILDKTTGYGVKSGLASVTVFGECSEQCDALSTICFLLGKEQGMALIDGTDGSEAVFIEEDGEISVSKGLIFKGKKLTWAK